MSKFHLLAGVAVAGLTLLSNPASAADDAPPESSTVVVIAQREAEAARAEIAKRPGGVDLVERADFDDRLAVSLRDTLAFSPGVYAQPRFGQEVRLSIRGSGISRGYHMRGLTLLQDGIPINLADDNGDFQEIDPQVLERIEVFRGANALRFGGSTLGGAINAVTPTGRTAPRLEARIDGGSFNTVRAKLAAGFVSGAGDAFVAVTGDRSDGDRDHARRSALRFTGNVGLRLSDRVDTRFFATINHIRQELPGSLTLAQALATPELSLPGNIVSDQRRDIDSIRLQNRTTADLGDGKLTVGAFYNAKQLFHPIFMVIDQKGEDRGIVANLDWQGTVGDIAWEATLGSQARFGRNTAKQFVNVGGRRGAPTLDSRQRAHTIDSYAELRISPTPALTLIAGGIHVSGMREIVNRTAPARSGSMSFDAFAPKFGVLYRAANDVQFYANYSRSVELPGFAELGQTPAGGATGFVAVAPQRAWTAEIGTRGKAGIVAWDVSLYSADIDGEMLQFAIAPNIPAATFNAGQTRHRGVEAGLDLAFTPWARLRQVYQYSDFRFRRDAQYGDNRLPVIPPHLYRAELRLGGDRASVTPSVEWVPQGPWADYRNLVRTPGYATVGVGATAKLREGVSVFADARNLTGKKAIGDVSAVVAANPATVAYYPVERRAVYVGVRSAF